MLTFAFMHYPYLVCILFGMPSLHLFTFLMFFKSCVYSNGDNTIISDENSLMTTPSHTHPYTQHLKQQLSVEEVNVQYHPGVCAA